ncbi:MAG: hypothetical protein WEA75_09550 [Acidimicrobiia bacterium]
MNRVLRISLLAIVVLVALVAQTAAQPSADDGVGIGSLDPSSGAPGTEIHYTVVGSPIADSECRASSAFVTELLTSDGVRLTTGADTIIVPDTAAPGTAFVRLICYVSDTTGRRVIRGVCTSFEVVAAGTTVAPTPKTATGGTTLNEPCPPAGRVVMSESVIASQTALGEAFNQVIKPLGG